MLLLMLGLFAIDNGAWSTALSAHASPAGVDYRALGPTGLDAYLQQVASADLSGASREAKMAFYINAYNALTVDMMAENLGVASIRDLDSGKVWDSRHFVVAGQDMTLNDIEHKTLRPMGDPRVHAALNCASKGCPPLPLEPIQAATLDAQLDKAARRWVATNAWTLQDEQVAISKIFDWYGQDFVSAYGASLHDIPGVDGKQEAALNFIAAHAQNPGLAAAARDPGVPVVYMDYDWRVNKR